jgi:hypothetical protein
MTDFGADEPFAGAAAKLREHYGIDVPVAAVRAITEQHEAAMLASPKGVRGQSPRASPVDYRDGWEMVPRVETAAVGVQ